MTTISKLDKVVTYLQELALINFRDIYHVVFRGHVTNYISTYTILITNSNVMVEWWWLTLWGFHSKKHKTF